MKRIIIFLFSFIALTTLAGCFHYPQLADIPLISEKSELRIEGGITAIPGVAASISYGLTNNIAVQGFAITSSVNNYFQASTGIYKRFNDNKVFETYVGYGLGRGDHFDSSTGGDLKGPYKLYFGLVNFGQIRNENSKFEYAMSIKSGFLSSDLMANNNFFEPPNDSNLQLSDNSLLIEPAGLIRFGGDKIKLSLKVGYNYIHKFTNQNFRIPYAEYNFGLGLNYNLR